MHYSHEDRKGSSAERPENGEGPPLRKAKSDRNVQATAADISATQNERETYKKRKIGNLRLLLTRELAVLVGLISSPQRFVQLGCNGSHTLLAIKQTSLGTSQCFNASAYQPTDY